MISVVFLLIWYILAIFIFRLNIKNLFLIYKLLFIRENVKPSTSRLISISNVISMRGENNLVLLG